MLPAAEGSGVESPSTASCCCRSSGSPMEMRQMKSSSYYQDLVAASADADAGADAAVALDAGGSWQKRGWCWKKECPDLHKKKFGLLNCYY